MEQVGWIQLMLMPPRLDLIAENVPAYVGRAIQVMIAKEPEKRPATMALVASELRGLYARYTKSTVCAPRELWHEGAGAAEPLPQELIPRLATTTQTDVLARARNAQNTGQLAPPGKEVPRDGIAPTPVIVSVTKPFPSAVRDAPPNREPPIAAMAAPEPMLPVARNVPSVIEPPVVIRYDDAPAHAVSVAAARALVSPSDEPISQNSRVRQVAADAESGVSQQGPQERLPPPHVPAALVTRQRPLSLRIHWDRLLMAAGAGILLGLTALIASFSLSRQDQNANAGSPAESVAKATVASTRNEPPASTAVALPIVMASAPTNEAPAAPAAAKSSAAPKPAPRKPKPSAGKLPFGADDLTF